MSYIRVTRPERARPRAGGIVAAAAITAVLVLTALPAFQRVPVLVDGRPYLLLVGTPFGEVAERRLGSGEPGDLVDVSTDGVIEQGAGLPARLYVDGVPVDPEEPIRGPVSVETEPGEDVVEEVVVVARAIDVPVAYEGEGPIATLVQAGSAGVAQVTEGKLSGLVVDEVVVEAPLPMIVRLSEPAAGDRIVALTFDDGPWPGQTEEILAILDAENVRATFFMLGVQVRSHPALAREVARAGHAIGNHTQSHRMLLGADADTVGEEIAACQRTLREAAGVAPTLFRPPGGLADATVYAEAREAGMDLVRWTVDPQDWREPTTDELSDSVLGAVHPSAVVLLHDGGGDRSATVAALPEIIGELRARGYRFVTLDDVPSLAG